MNKPIKILKQKKGMTLIETIITFIIAGILIAATGALIITGLNLFNDTAARNNDKQIADSVLEIARDNIQYAKSVSADEGIAIGDGNLDDYFQISDGAIYTVNDTDSTKMHGRVFFKKPGDDKVTDLYPSDSFYSGRTVGISMTVDKVDPPKAITITVKVYKDDKVVNTRSTSFQLLNSTELDDPVEQISYPEGTPILFIPVE